MDTTEARETMRELGRRGLEVIFGFINGECSAADASRRLKESIDQARGVLSDAGYPAESVWRGLQRGQALFSSSGETREHDTWTELAGELREAIETLDGLLSRPVARDADFRIVG